jgi:hypothetical protein
MHLYSFRMVSGGSNSDDPPALNEGPEFLPKVDIRSTSARFQKQSSAIIRVRPSPLCQHANPAVP